MARNHRRERREAEALAKQEGTLPVEAPAPAPAPAPNGPAISTTPSSKLEVSATIFRGVAFTSAMAFAIGAIAAADLLIVALIALSGWVVSGVCILADRQSTKRTKGLFVTGVGALFLAVWTIAYVRHPDEPVFHERFSQTQTVNNFPVLLGGTDTLNLDNLGSLKVGSLYSLQSVEMIANPAVTELPGFRLGPLIVIKREFFPNTPGDTIRFDETEHKRHDVKVDGRTFVITLREIRRLPNPEIANPMQFVFAISEK